MRRGFGVGWSVGVVSLLSFTEVAWAQEEAAAPTEATVDDSAPPAETEPGGAVESVESPPAAAEDRSPAEESDGASEQLMVEAAPIEPLEPYPAQPKRSAGPYARGTINIGGSFGFISSIGGGSSRSWVILGLGGGYYFLDGLEARGDATFWIGDPFVATLTPGIRYVFHMVPVVQPYVGTFYRHYFVTGALSDTDSLGARAGLNFQFTRGGYLGLGAVYEHFLDSNLFSEPDQVYPELTVAIAF